MVFKPAASLQTQFGTNVYPNVTQQPVTLQTKIDASQNWWAQNATSADVVAEDISNFYSSSISQFVQRQRQAYSLGGYQFRRVQSSFPGLNLDYCNNGGLEVLSMTIAPESFAPGAPLQPEIIGATEFAPGVYMHQDNQVVEDTDKLTISLWFRIHKSDNFDNGGAVSLLQFGPKDGEQYPGNSSFGVPFIKTHGSVILATKSGVGLLFVGGTFSTSWYQCNVVTGSIFQKTIKTTAASPGTDNILHFGAVPDWASGSMTVDIAGIPTTAVLYWVYTEQTYTVVGTGQKITLKPGDVVINNPVIATNGENATFTVSPVIGKYDGSFQTFPFTSQLGVSYFFNADIVPDVWHHFACAVDLTATYIETPPDLVDVLQNLGPGHVPDYEVVTPPNIKILSAPKLYAILDGVDISPTTYPPPDFNFDFTVPIEKGMTRPIQFGLGEFDTSLIAAGQISYGDLSNSSNTNASVPASAICPVGSAPEFAKPIQTNVTIPPWKISFNGGSVGVPLKPSLDDGVNRAMNVDTVDMAAVQIWTDLAVDITDSKMMEKLVIKTKDNKLILVPPVFAQAQFGAPKFLFDKLPPMFVINVGKPGDEPRKFDKVGEPKAFFPYPLTLPLAPP